tara:strand:+ start:980 stop:1396 length:417 start_codon:yes stop_codon:yes gene_type:complete
MATKNLTKRFLKGLEEVGVTYEEMRNNWKYAGGNQKEHLNYFRLAYPNDLPPPFEHNCVCGHDINEQCYITDGECFLVVGNCCIKKFLLKSGRTCENCGSAHKNRIVNRCNDCRVGVCDGCGKDIDEKYKKCYDCKYN